MKTKHIFIAFGITVLAQLIIPAQMVFENEMAYSSGTEYKFKTQPVDPSDPFRGKYIHLDFEAGEVKVAEGDWGYNQEGYVVLGKDQAGFARINALVRDKPAKGDYVKVVVDYNYDGKVHIEYPFDRFYMEESKAPDAEIGYRKFSRNGAKLPAYAIIAIRGETAVAKDVIIDSMPVKDYVEKHRKPASEKTD